MPTFWLQSCAIYVSANDFKLIESIQPERAKAKEMMEKKQQEKPSITYNIESVGQLNPAAMSVENNYERPSVGQQIDDSLTAGNDENEDLNYMRFFKAMELYKGLTKKE